MLRKDELIQIYETYHRDIINFIYKYVRNTETAEDLLNDCFEKLIVYSKKKDINIDNIKSFLLAIAHNLCINYIKHNKKITTVSMDDRLKSTSASHDFLKDVIKKELNEKIYKILDTCEPSLAAVFTMHNEAGLSFEEIGKIMGKTSRTVRRKMDKVILIIRDGLKKESLL